MSEAQRPRHRAPDNCLQDLLALLDRIRRTIGIVANPTPGVRDSIDRINRLRQQCENMPALVAMVCAGGIRVDAADILVNAEMELSKCFDVPRAVLQEFGALHHELRERCLCRLAGIDAVMVKQADELQKGKSVEEVWQSLQGILRELGVSNPQGEGCDGKELEAALKGLRRAAWRASAERNEPAKLKLMRDTFRAIEEKSRKERDGPDQRGGPTVSPAWRRCDSGVPTSGPQSSSWSTASQPRPEFHCPISRKVMLDPVVLETGHSYERTAILDWIDKGYTVCPQSGKQFDTSARLVPNLNLRDAISHWMAGKGSTPAAPDVQGRVLGTTRAALAGRSRSISFAGAYDYHHSCPAPPKALDVGAAEVDVSFDSRPSDAPQPGTPSNSITDRRAPRSSTASKRRDQVGADVGSDSTRDMPIPRAAEEASPRGPPRAAEDESDSEESASRHWPGYKPQDTGRPKLAIDRRESSSTADGNSRDHQHSPASSKQSSYHRYFMQRRAAMRTYFSYVSEVESRWSSQLLPQPDDDAEFLPEAPIPLGPQPKTVLDQNAAIESISRHIHTLRTNTNLKARAVAVQAIAGLCRTPGYEHCKALHEVDQTMERWWCERADWLVCGGGIDALVGILRSGEPDFMRLAACQALAGAAAASDLPLAAALNVRVVEHLLDILAASSHPSVVEAAAWALVQVTGGSDTTLISAMDTGILANLVALLEMTKDRIGEISWNGAAAAAVWLLHGIILSAEEMGIVVGCEAGIEPAVAILQADDPDLRFAVISFLGVLAEASDANCVRIVRAGAMPAISSMAGQKGCVATAEICVALQHKLMQGEGGRSRGVESGGVRAYLNLLQKSPKSLPAWLCLAELSECKAGAEQIAEAPGAIQLICRQALHLCNRTSSPAEPGRFCTAETGAVCARTLRSITASSKGVSQVVACGGVEVLLHLLTQSWRDCAALAARSLWNIVHHSEGKAALASHVKSAPALLRAAQAGGLQGRECAAETLRLLCASSTGFQRQLRDIGAASVLKSVVSSAMSPKIVESASLTLKYLNC